MAELARPSRQWRDKWYLPLLAVLLALTIPTSIIANNLADLQHLDPGFTLAALAIMAMGLAVAMAAVSWVLGILGPAKWLLVLGRFALFFCALTGLLFPAVTSISQVDVNDLPLNLTNIGISAGLALGLVVATFTRLHGIIFMVFVTAALGTAASNSVVILTSITKFDATPMLTLSSTKNIIVMSFDGLPRDMMIEALSAEPTSAVALKDFTVFDNVMSSAAATALSIAAELTGIRDLTSVATTSEELREKTTDDAMITNALAQQGYSVSTYGNYVRNLSDTSRQFARGSLSGEPSDVIKFSEVAAVLDLAAARTLGPTVSLGDQVATAARPLLVALPGQQARLQSEKLVEEQLASHAGADWDVGAIRGPPDLNGYLTNQSVGTAQPVAHFLHFTFTHHPVDLDANCELRSVDSAWFASSQNRSGEFGEVQCAIRRFSQVIDRLKALGAYDNALVILKSDHGAIVELNDPTRYEGFEIRDHAYYGFGRYTPFLAIKKPNETRQAFALDNRNVALSDLATTLCREAIGDGGYCDRYEGFDLLDSAPIPPGKTYFAYIARDASSDIRLEDQEAVELSRDVPIFEALADFLTNEKLVSVPTCGVWIPLQEGDPWNTGKANDRNWVHWREGERIHLKFLKPDCPGSSVALTLVSVDGAPPALQNDLSAMNPQVDSNNSTLTLTIPIPESASIGEPVRLTFDAGARIGATTLWGMVL